MQTANLGGCRSHCTTILINWLIEFQIINCFFSRMAYLQIPVISSDRPFGGDEKEGRNPVP
jgi:hypothetical protein